MTAPVSIPETIFERAIAISDPAERASYLDRACGGNSALRRDAERLVQDHFQAGSFLEQPGLVLDITTPPPAMEQIGAMIGPYKLLEQIGEGGMGLVYMAEQQRPVRRLVALKLVKPGMDSKQVIARFEAERQALAMMDHPNIAKILDAGTTGQSTKSEARNPKRIQSTKQKAQNEKSAGDSFPVSDMDHSNLEFVSNFVLRILPLAALSL